MLGHDSAQLLAQATLPLVCDKYIQKHTCVCFVFTVGTLHYLISDRMTGQQSHPECFPSYLRYINFIYSEGIYTQVLHNSTMHAHE